ncbi:uncharacterized protein ARB_05243 [Trichophyton benhamiae CBS 112371]|uniref:Uncharacterized protein n=1 Tax=Arthroderma benhamiae (strain ATCC MYA-4681 / CBS 112371) TaxID=663331 RepID=D4ALP5_ARTBC|nr:uncharacterized protein ARB_05243 [Trichophyton benhamiae CBS 112371]EFE36304.1 hypothetical protein ARB_05243 [Trichophyton benhamiae CBS 112371]
MTLNPIRRLVNCKEESPTVAKMWLVESYIRRYDWVVCPYFGFWALEILLGSPKTKHRLQTMAGRDLPCSSRVEHERKHIHTLSETTLVKLAADRELPLSGWDVEETQDPLVVSIECPKKGT